ncbi:hypothetical protein [Bartonella tamiae]|nr:hypothetical protein [Bartonella tamiae]
MFSFAPSRAMKELVLYRSNVSGSTKGTVGCNNLIREIVIG